MSQRKYDDSELVADGLQNSADDAKWGKSVKSQVGALTPPPPAKTAPANIGSAFQMALDAQAGYDEDEDEEEEEEEDLEAEIRAEARKTLEKTLKLLKNSDDLRERASKSKDLAEIKAINKEAKLRYASQDESEDDEQPTAKRSRPAEVAPVVVPVAPTVAVALAATAAQPPPPMEEKTKKRSHDAEIAESRAKVDEPTKSKKKAKEDEPVVQITSAPPFGILHFMFGSKFIAQVAQVLVAKGAQSVIGTLEQNSFLSNLASAIIELPRPDIVDEAGHFKSKSSSVSDKETVAVVRQVNQKPKQLAAQVEQKRLAQLKDSLKNSDSKLKRLLGVASLMAADVALNACVVVSPDRTQVAVATALGAHKKHKFAHSLGPLIGAGLMAKTVVDAELDTPWRLCATRLSLLPCSPDNLLLTASGASNKSQKRFRFNEDANVSFPPSQPEAPKTPRRQEAATAAATVPPPPPFSMPIKVVGGFGRVVGASEHTFKHNVKKIIEVYGREITLLPNSTMMALLSMVFEALNTHLQIHDLIAPNYQYRLTAKNCNLPKVGADGKPTKKEYPQIKVLPGVFSCITESSIDGKTKKYYDDHPNEVRSHQMMFVERSREIALSYSVGKNTTETEVIAFGELVLPVAHILFGFLRLDERLSKQPVGEPAVHPAGRVVESDRDRVGADVQLGCNELPVGVWFRMPNPAKTLLTKMWKVWLEHLKLLDAEGELVSNAGALFPERYREAKYGAHQWIVDYLSPSSTKPTPEQRAEFREIMVPVMYSLFPPAFMGEVPDKK